MKTKTISVVVTKADADRLAREASAIGRTWGVRITVSDVIRERLGCQPVELGGYRRGGGRPKREAS